MNLIDRKTEFEEKLIAIRKESDSEVMVPSYMETIDEVTTKRVADRIYQMRAAKLNPPDRMHVYTQHLADTYHVSPQDLEFLIRLFIDELDEHLQLGVRRVLNRAIPVLVDEYGFDAEELGNVFAKQNDDDDVEDITTNIVPFPHP